MTEWWEKVPPALFKKLHILSAGQLPTRAELASGHDIEVFGER